MWASAAMISAHQAGAHERQRERHQRSVTPATPSMRCKCALSEQRTVRPNSAASVPGLLSDPNTRTCGRSPGADAVEVGGLEPGLVPGLRGR